MRRVLPHQPDVRFAVTGDGATIGGWPVGEAPVLAATHNDAMSHAEWKWEVASHRPISLSPGEHQVIRFDPRGFGRPIPLPMPTRAAP